MIITKRDVVNVMKCVMKTNDFDYMREALKEAGKALALNEVPVGAVVVKDGVIIGRGFNQRHTKQNSLMHAEVIAINEACQTLGQTFLDGTTIYVTLEPCLMCTGAIMLARIERLVYGLPQPDAGCIDSVMEAYAFNFTHHVKVQRGVLEEEAKKLLETFFARLRK